MDFYEILTNDIITYVRDYQNEDSSYDNTYRFENYGSIDALLDDVKNYEYDNDALFYGERVSTTDLQDYITEFASMCYNNSLKLTPTVLKEIFKEDWYRLSIYLKNWIFPICIERAKEILRPEFFNDREYSEDDEVPIDDEDYDEGFDEELEESRKRHKRRKLY